MTKISIINISISISININISSMRRPRYDGLVNENGKMKYLFKKVDFLL